MTTAVMAGEKAPTGDKDSFQVAEEALGCLSEGAYAKLTESFSEELRKALPPEKMKAVWLSILSQAGPLKETTWVRSETDGPHDAAILRCSFEKQALDFKVVIDKEGVIVGLRFLPVTPAWVWEPPAYAKPGTFQEKEVSVGSGEFPLPGTLSLPVASGPFPAVVLVHGSGPQDRDTTIGPNKIFRDLAWGLSSRGIAVLRYEKRTKTYGYKLAREMENLTVAEETMDDAIAAVETLSQRPEIDPTRIILLGHSLGGTLIPRMARQAKSVAGFVIMAGATRPLEELYLEQSEKLLAWSGPMTAEKQCQLTTIREQIALLHSDALSPGTPARLLPMGLPAGYWLDLKGYRPAHMAAAMDRPMLILHGERDYQVTLEDYNGWKKALADQERVSLKLYPGLNHLFMHGEAPSRPSEYKTPGHVAPAVIEDIGEWIEVLPPMIKVNR